MIIDDERYTSSEDIASKLNEYFANISVLFDYDCREGQETDISHLENFIHNKVPDDVHFKIPNITLVQVLRKPIRDIVFCVRMF